MVPSVSPRVIHVIFKTHLDVGFTDYAGRVVANYFEHFIPAALDLADEMRRRGGSDRFLWTTGSWLIYEYLEKAPPAQRERMDMSIRLGDIVWHGLPFTTHSELNDVELFRSGLRLSADLDKRFGRKTIAAKMTDVPGHTRGMVPLLAEAGIQFLHIGVNEASTPPDVPPVFRWRDPSGAEVMVMYHKGYGDLMLVPGLDEGIYFAHTGDNLGPQKPEDVEATFRALRKRFPGAEVRASTLDAFAGTLEQVRETLPVVSAEIGDSWIHGGGSDPIKVARLRELLRLRTQWLTDGRIPPDDPAYSAFSRSLQLVTEHTWGMDEKTHLQDYENYAAVAFQRARSLPNFVKFESSWAEQRGYINSAVEALSGAANGQLLQEEARAALAAIEPQRPDEQTWTRVDPYQPFGAGRYVFGFNDSGALAYLRDRTSRRTLADPNHPLGQLLYQTFSEADYSRFYRQYNVNKRKTWFWALADFTKPDMGASAEAGEWLPKLERLYIQTGEHEERFLLNLSFPGKPVSQFGAPAEAYIELRVPLEGTEIHFDLQWFDKAACRLPEAIWFSFIPRTASGETWEIEKLGAWVSPLDVVRNGNRHLHATGRGVRCQQDGHGFEIESLDAPLVAPGQRSLLDFNNRQPAMSKGVHFLLLDNLWGTNFPMWFDEDARFRFTLKLNV